MIKAFDETLMHALDECEKRDGSDSLAVTGSLPIRRRRYTCPECGLRGRSSNKNRYESKNRCPYCGEWFHLQIQTKDGVYMDPCKSVNKIEYYI